MSKLVLSRKVGEAVCIGDDVKVTVVLSAGRQLRLAIDAPDHVPIHREELIERIAAANREAARAAAPLEAEATEGA